MLDAPDSSFLTDTVQLVPVDTELDDAGAPVNPNDATGTPVACAVQRASATTMAPEMGGVAVESSSRREILFASSPGSVVAGQAIRWTHRAGTGTAGTGTALSPAVILTAEGPASPPGGLMARWTVHARIVS